MSTKLDRSRRIVGALIGVGVATAIGVGAVAVAASSSHDGTTSSSSTPAVTTTTVTPPLDPTTASGQPSTSDPVPTVPASTPVAPVTHPAPTSTTPVAPVTTTTVAATLTVPSFIGTEPTGTQYVGGSGGPWVKVKGTCTVGPDMGGPIGPQGEVVEVITSQSPAAGTVVPTSSSVSVTVNYTAYPPLGSGSQGQVAIPCA